MNGASNIPGARMGKRLGLQNRASGEFDSLTGCHESHMT